MDSQCHSFSLNLELRIVRVRNIYLKSSRGLFVRCFLPAGSNKRVRIDSQEISSNSNLTWNQTFSLDCLGNEDTIKSLKQETIVFELRSRNSSPLIARMSGSKLLARAEMPWNDVVKTTNMEIERWVVMITKNGCVHSDDVKPPAVQIAMKVQESRDAIERKKFGERRWDDCGCMDRGCNSCVDYEFFAIGAALEAF